MTIQSISSLHRHNLRGSSLGGKKLAYALSKDWGGGGTEVTEKVQGDSTA